jgi:hypothetical protein
MGTQTARSSAPNAFAGRAARETPWGLLTAAAGVAAWLIVDPKTPDLAAQVYRANLFREAGFLLWDTRWYGGHGIPAYSLLFPPAAALVGVRTVGAAAVLVSAALFERIVRPVYGKAARWGAVWFAAAAVGDVWSGRVTFALGVSVALGAVAALMRGGAKGRWWTVAAALLAAVCAACSPVAGALLAMAGLVWSLSTRSPRAAAVLVLPPAAVTAALVALFPEGGWEPFPFRSFLAAAAVGVAWLWALPKGRRSERLGGTVYLAACGACVAVHTPVGANVERYGVLLAGPVLVCALAGSKERLSAAKAAVVVGIAVWTVWGPVRETAAVAGNGSTEASYYLPVERFVARAEASLGGPVRVEVPFTRGHWEAAWLAEKVSLARGWEKQLDERYDGVLLAKGLTAAGYRAWLANEAVRYVALPDTSLDPSSAQEGRLIERGLPYLREVERARHWRIYEVRGTAPLASGPGRLSAIGHDAFTLDARTEGRFDVRLRYTKYWTVTTGVGCVGEAPGGWTEVTTERPGPVTVSARFSLGGAIRGKEMACRPGPRKGEAGMGAVRATGAAAGTGAKATGATTAGSYAPKAPRRRAGRQTPKEVRARGGCPEGRVRSAAKGRALSKGTSRSSRSRRGRRSGFM